MMEGLDFFGEGNWESADCGEFDCFLWVLGFGGMFTTQKNRKDQGTYSDGTYPWGNRLPEKQKIWLVYFDPKVAEAHKIS